MRQDYSRTAEGMAMVRALEQQQVPRIIDDPFAIRFLLNPYYRRMASSRLLSGVLLRFLRYWAPGGQEFLTIRPRLVDDLVTAEAANGLKQVVILGAGFDTHAWRCRSALTHATVFEIDHPATQQTKRELSQSLGVPGNLRFVAVDFEKDDFAERLLAAGFNAELPTYFVWVGVSYYLTAQAVADTLQRIASLSRAGTKLVWDYMLADVVDGTSANREALGKGRRAAQLGEPWLWGIAPAELPAYLTGFGFRLIHDYEPAELRERYAPARATPMNYVRIAVCERVTVFTLPNAAQAVVELAKLYDYCLSVQHPRGKHKARVFQAALGLGQEDEGRLRAAMLQAVLTQPARQTTVDQYGQRYVVTFRMQTKVGSAMVISSWIVLAHEDFPRLTSCYVAKDGGQMHE